MQAIVGNIEPTDRPPDLNVPFNENELSFTKNPLTFSEILEACKQLESKTSLDFEGLSLHFVKKVILSIHAPILHVFRLSLSSGVVPSQFKIAKVVPVFKNGDKTNPDNYRPISLLSSFSKILEKVVLFAYVCSWRKKRFCLSSSLVFENLIRLSMLWSTF